MCRSRPRLLLQFGLLPNCEVLRRRVIWMLVEHEFLNQEFALKLMAWKHSGFSIDNSVRILDQEAKENLAEYISRPPNSLKKIRYEPFKGRVLFHTKYSEYFGPTPRVGREPCTCSTPWTSWQNSPNMSRQDVNS